MQRAFGDSCERLDRTIDVHIKNVQEDRARSRESQAHRHGGRVRIQVRMTRLRWKLLAAMVALVVVTLGVSALFARQVSHEQVRRLLVKRPGPSVEQMVRALEDHLRQAGGWRGAGA